MYVSNRNLSLSLSLSLVLEAEPCMGVHNSAVMGNMLSGSLRSFSGMTNLTYFAVQLNKFTGPLPDISRSPLLATLYVQAVICHRAACFTLIHTLTESFMNFSSLASDNAFTGSVPNTGELLYLTNFVLANNSLSGSIPTSLAPNLTRLGLFNNSLTGPIPTTICQLSSLESLGLRDNSLKGVVPSCLFTLTKLRLLYEPTNSAVLAISLTRKGVVLAAGGWRLAYDTVISSTPRTSLARSRANSTCQSCASCSWPTTSSSASCLNLLATASS